MYFTYKSNEPTSTPKFDVGSYVKIKFSKDINCAVKLHRWEQKTTYGRQNSILFYSSWTYYLKCSNGHEEIVEEYMLDGD